MYDFLMVEPFQLPFSQPAVDDLRRRLRQTRWLEASSRIERSLGVNRDFLMDLCLYWMDTFDWKSQLERLAAFHHYRFHNKSGRIHFIYEKGKGPSPMQLILTHGWPGSLLEMLDILPLLKDPAAYGHDAEDSFDLIIPSIPGFGFFRQAYGVRNELLPDRGHLGRTDGGSWV